MSRHVIIVSATAWVSRVVRGVQGNARVGWKMTPKECVKRLRRRSNHLKKRIANNPGKDLSYDRSEINALDFAVSIIEKLSKPKRSEAVASSFEVAHG